MAMNKKPPKTDHSKRPYAKGRRGKGMGGMTHKYNEGMHYGKTY